MVSLTCFKIRDRIDGRDLVEFDDVIDTASSVAGRMVALEPITLGDAEARLYLINPAPHQPEWAGFLADGFSNAAIPMNASAGALLLVRLRHDRKTKMAAYAFGTSGRYLMRDDAYERNFGLRSALNIMFEGDDGGTQIDPSRIRSVDGRRLSRQLRRRTQSTHGATLEGLDFDLDRDLLRGITGTPANKDQWGQRVTGMDSLHLMSDVLIQKIDALTRNILDAFTRDDYRARFSFVDDVSIVRDDETLAELEQIILEKLKSEDLAGLELSIPEIVEWNRISWFRFPGEGRSGLRHGDLSLGSLISSLRQAGRLDDLNVERLKQMRIVALEEDGTAAGYQWTVWRCLAGEIARDGEQFILDDTELFRVEDTYLKQLNRFIKDQVADTTLTLPKAAAKMVEQEYNVKAAETSDDLLCMDRRTVRLARSTTPVEICDLLSAGRQLVHVKRRLGSSALSHLFNQGFVSAELLHSSRDFRDQAIAKVSEAAEMSGKPKAAFAVIPSDGFDPRDVEVVFAMIANWKGATLVKRLPFFSKVTLRQVVQDLTSRGYRVTVARIQTEI